MLMLEAFEDLRTEGLKRARALADYYAANQRPYRDYLHGAGTFPPSINFLGTAETGATNWLIGFASMGQLAAAKAFKSDLYGHSAEKMMNYLRSLQIFDPYVMTHYGAIREITAHTPWCYVRDALSGAWGFLEYYRATGNAEYLERAKLWSQWYFKHGCDERFLPKWGVSFGPPVSGGTPEMLDHMLGDFSGGSLNFFYQMYRTTGDAGYVDDRFTAFAEFYLNNCRRPEGFFKTVRKADGSVPEDDPQQGLHKSNDDFSSLGLLCAYRVTGDRRYLDAVGGFLDWVFSVQQADGSFETSAAGIPVVLNIMLESEGLLGPWPESRLEAARRALLFLMGRQSSGDIIPAQRGGIDEYGDCRTGARASGYALIVLLKLFADEKRFLTAE
ncbi:MAG: hypothetical protein PHI85_03145 [Victivallaceae bacterium]|nr:hypothetical protein [Victivallaceae bacterium]